MFTTPEDIAEGFLASTDGGLLVLTDKLTAVSVAWLGEYVDASRAVAIITKPKSGFKQEKTGSAGKRKACEVLSRTNVRMGTWHPEGRARGSTSKKKRRRGTLLVSKRDATPTALVGTPQLTQTDMRDEFHVFAEVIDVEATRLLLSVNEMISRRAVDVTEQVIDDWGGLPDEPDLDLPDTWMKSPDAPALSVARDFSPADLPGSASPATHTDDFDCLFAPSGQ